MLFAGRLCFSVILPAAFLNYKYFNFCDIETLLINLSFHNTEKLINELRLNRKPLPNEILCYSYVLRTTRNQPHFLALVIHWGSWITFH
jgi:hypothetical protein